MTDWVSIAATATGYSENQLYYWLNFVAYSDSDIYKLNGLRERAE